MRVRPDLESIRTVGQSLSALIAGVMTEADAGRMELCVIEALTNVVKHGGLDATKTGDQIDVQIDVEDKHVAVTIFERGVQIPAEAISAASGLDVNPEDLLSLPENGMGLFIINEFVDELDYSSSSDGLNRLYLMKRCAV